ncbi:MAG: sulfatase [Deltaproteobacteria bacterium]|nr:sulfatase [Deltaproteobacteria bacterium]
MSRRPSRREVLCGLSAFGAGAALSSCGKARPVASAARPNVVVILADDLAWRAWGGAGAYPFLSTPNLDRLAAEGATFDNGFCTTSLCSPSRASLLTGCYAHRHGVLANGVNDPDPAIPQYPQLLQQQGYETALIGKWQMRRGAEPRPGFDYWLSFFGQGPYLDPTLNENGVETLVPGYTTDLLTDYAVRWLERPRPSPFCMILSHKAVHGPWTPAPRHAGAFPDAELPKPESFDDDYATKPRWLRRATLWGEDEVSWAASAGYQVPDTLPPAVFDPHDPPTLDYMRCLLAFDDSVGRVLQTLEAQGELDNTFVFVTSDNGFMLGAHRRGDKRLMYEESIRIPMLVRFPPLVPAGARLDAMALTIDLAPTLLELAGAPIPEVMQGASWLPLFAGDDGGWRQAFLYEYFPEGWVPGIARIQGVRTSDWKLIRYPDVTDDTDELYDLENDPFELVNLIGDPAHAAVLAGLDAELARLRPA